MGHFSNDSVEERCPDARTALSVRSLEVRTFAWFGVPLIADSIGENGEVEFVCASLNLFEFLEF